MKCVEAEDKFYDENVGECSHCSVICTDHEYKGTTDECEEKCSVYLAKQTPQQVAYNHKTNSLVAEQTGGASDSSSPLLHPGWIAAIVIGSIAIICTTLIAIALVRTCSSQYTPAPQDENTRPRKPVEETSQQGDSAHFAIDGVGNPAEASQAFSDLPVDGSRSDSRRPVLS
ncbi:hypothetical protein V1264_012581 [Littorina saxatilis]|uniref:Uncharacterized protein n=2 Tax=Littorina saxatilis TaxID=31220 RepID=A0AAN9GM57_9CAEN